MEKTVLEKESGTGMAYWLTGIQVTTSTNDEERKFLSLRDSNNNIFTGSTTSLETKKGNLTWKRKNLSTRLRTKRCIEEEEEQLVDKNLCQIRFAVGVSKKGIPTKQYQVLLI